MYRPFGFNIDVQTDLMFRTSVVGGTLHKNQKFYRYVAIGGGLLDQKEE